MPFDANLVLADTSLDWDFANLGLYGTPTSSTIRNTGGFIVIDLLALSGTPGQGLACVFLADEIGGVTDALTLLLQASNLATFVSSPTNPVHTLANFEVAGATHGIILGNELPCTVVRRFSTTLRFIRVDASLADAGDDFNTCRVLLAPWPFHIL